MVMLCLLMVGCYRNLRYADEKIAEINARGPCTGLEYQTRAGRQTAFYIAPRMNTGHPPEILVIIYPGIDSLALDWLNVVDQAPDPRAGFLLIDYPGRGKNGGTMHPKYLHESSSKAIKALEKCLGVPAGEWIKQIRLLGHSFGCGVALQFVSYEKIERIVLIAPFTTLHKIAFRRFGPLAWLLPYKLDNSKRISELYLQQNRPLTIIIHGASDESIPVEMGRELAAMFPDWILYHEIAGAGHSDILKTSRQLIFNALFSQPAE